MDSLTQCINASNSLYDDICNRPEILGKVKFAPKERDTRFFRLEFIRPKKCVHRIYGLSISFPTDAMGNRGLKYGEGFPSTIETTLLGEIPQYSDIFDADSIYDENCGYSDVCRFFDTNSLVEEIVRISNYLSSTSARR